MTSEVVAGVATWYAPAMRLHSHLLLAALIAGSLASAQAMRPPPAAAPASGPAIIIQQPPTYPGATYTPAGTGLPTIGQPGTQRPAVERSPNKRVLPPTKEPGLWAADGAPVAAARHHLWGVEIPLPEGAMAHLVEREAWHCADGMDEVAKGIRKVAFIDTLPEDVRRCMVARAQYHCAFEEGLLAQRHVARGSTSDAARLEPLAALEAHALALRAKWCADDTLTDKQQTALRTVLDAWDKSTQRGE